MKFLRRSSALFTLLPFLALLLLTPVALGISSCAKTVSIGGQQVDRVLLTVTSMHSTALAALLARDTAKVDWLCASSGVVAAVLPPPADAILDVYQDRVLDQIPGAQWRVSTCFASAHEIDTTADEADIAAKIEAGHAHAMEYIDKIDSLLRVLGTDLHDLVGEARYCRTLAVVEGAEAYVPGFAGAWAQVVGGDYDGEIPSVVIDYSACSG